MSDERQYQTKVKNAAINAGIGIFALTAFLSTFLFGTDRASIGYLSQLLRFKVDLGDCALGFSRLLIAETVFTTVFGMLLAAMVLLAIFDMLVMKRSFRVYRRGLLGIAIFPFLLLGPVVFGGDSTWVSKAKFISRVNLDQACLASHHTVFYRLYFAAVMMTVLSWGGVILAAAVRANIRFDRDPERLSNDPKVRAAQLRIERITTARSTATTLTLKAIACVAAVAVFALAASAMSFSVKRAWHTLTWDRQQLTVVTVGTACTLDKKLPKRDWQPHQPIPCSLSLQEAIRDVPVPERNSAKWRIARWPTADLRYRAPDGRIGEIHTEGDFLVLEGLPIGSEVTLLQNPDNPGNFDRIFEWRDLQATATKMLLILAGAAVVYFILLRKRFGRSAPPGGSPRLPAADRSFTPRRSAR